MFFYSFNLANKLLALATGAFSHCGTEQIVLIGTMSKSCKVKNVLGAKKSTVHHALRDGRLTAEEFVTLQLLRYVSLTSR